ncbi:pilus assembly protein TadG-related protein [Streptomyces hypolithicus]
MIVGFRQDRGQTLPMYVVVVGGLLFLAFAYFAFAQAAAARNSGQSAADAAALAAAQEVRDELTDGFYDALADPAAWLKWLMAEEEYPDAEYQAAADELAARNDSDVEGAVVPTEVDGYPAFKATIKTRFTVGDSVIPGTESRRVNADATAVIEPRCAVSPGSESQELIEIDCKGSGHWEIDPTTPLDEMENAPEARDLFSVHLAE